MLAWLAPYVIFIVYRSLQWSWRVQLVHSDGAQKLLDLDQSFIIAHWHGDEMGIFFRMKPYRAACMVSTSKDGTIMAKLIELCGGKASRGSATRQGAQALKGILRLAKEGLRPSIAVDGPKGPIYKAKPGVFQISRLGQIPIVPIAYSASRAWTFHKSWNKGTLPKPFSRVTVLMGEPFEVIQKDEDCRDPKLALKLEEALKATKEKARKA